MLINTVWLLLNYDHVTFAAPTPYLNMFPTKWTCWPCGCNLLSQLCCQLSQSQSYLRRKGMEKNRGRGKGGRAWRRTGEGVKEERYGEGQGKG